MPEPIDSIASARILEHYQAVSSLGAGVLVRGVKQPSRIVDTVQISQEAREKLRQFNQAKRDGELCRERRRREQDEALKNSLEVLELGAEASREAVRKAYHHLMHHYHPDKYAHLPAEFRKLAEAKARQIIKAYETLGE